jgi:pimeloyl-ACP methyl ester carboxylesterase
MVAVLDGVGIERTYLVGHDFGASVAWFAATVPARVERLAVTSVGNPNALRTRSIEQRKNSWYQLFFQFKGVAEELLIHDDWKLFCEIAGGGGDLARNLQDLARPGASPRR